MEKESEYITIIRFDTLDAVRDFAGDDHEAAVIIRENEMIIVSKGVEHRPVAGEEVSVLLFEPAGTINTGDNADELTRGSLELI